MNKKYKNSHIKDERTRGSYCDILRTEENFVPLQHVDCISCVIKRIQHQYQIYRSEPVPAQWDFKDYMDRLIKEIEIFKYTEDFDDLLK